MKKILYIIPFLAMLLSLVACKKDNLTDFEQFVSYIYSSEETLNSYDETTTISDGVFEAYYKNVNVKLKRKDVLETSVVETERKATVSGGAINTVVTNYTTVGEKKYTVLNGETYQSAYNIPAYFLTFVLSEEYLDEGYSLTRNGESFELTGKIKNDYISSFFLNKSLTSVQNLSIYINIENGKLVETNFEYVSSNGFSTKIQTSYTYPISTDTINYAYAVFYLEGGVCQNAKEKITYRYNLGDSNEMLIVDPNELETDEGKMILKQGYFIEGWYRNKIVEGDKVTYTDPWDFENDKMTSEGVTLYAKWHANITHTYDVYYYDNNGVLTLNKSNKVNEGDVFNPNRHVADILGYTAIGYTDEFGNPWDMDYKHPGGDEDNNVKIILTLIEGDFELVYSASDLKKNKNKNIYLMNDIDLDGSKFSFNDYDGILLGNGYTISNFVVEPSDSRSSLLPNINEPGATKKDSLYASIFYTLEGATIKDVTFKDVTYIVDTKSTLISNVALAPLAVKVTNSTIENVSIYGTYNVVETPSDASFVAVTDKLYYVDGEGNSLNNNIFDILYNN